MNLVVLRHHEYGIERNGGRTAQRPGGLDAPQFVAGGRIQRHHIAHAVGGIDPPAVIAAPPPKVASRKSLGHGNRDGSTARRAVVPHRTRGSRRAGIDHEHLPSPTTGAAARRRVLVVPAMLALHSPRRGGGQRHMAGNLGGIAARLRPGGIGLRRGHHHRHAGKQGISDNSRWRCATESGCGCRRVGVSTSSFPPPPMRAFAPGQCQVPGEHRGRQSGMAS